MKIDGARILLTGAGGGIGRELAIQLMAKGARLAIVGRNTVSLQQQAAVLRQGGGVVIPIAADLTEPQAASRVIASVLEQLGGVDILINNAGVMDFILFEQQSPDRITEVIQTNVDAPLQLTRALLPHMLARQRGQIVNVGSIFGSLGFPHYAVYCASKFALYGFSQALRRELAHTPIAVTYVAPRAVDTALNDTTTLDMLKASNIALDAPQAVAAKIVRAIEQERETLYIGQPESFFAWLNRTLPWLVNIGLRKQARLARPYAESRRPLMQTQVGPHASPSVTKET